MGSEINQTFDVYKGEDRVIKFTPNKTINAVDAYTLIWEAKSTIKKSSVVADITKTSASGIIVTDSDKREISVTLNSSDTKDLKAGTYNWELWRTDNGSRKQLAEGQLNLLSTIRIF